MKELHELQQLLINELSKYKCLDRDRQEVDYYNDFLGDTSILISSILNEHLLEKTEWEVEKWIDDCLITKVIFDLGKWKIWGILIWGKEDTTQEWTDPFYFEIKTTLNGLHFLEYSFLVGDINSEEITYEEFTNDRGVWDKLFYSSNDWDVSERNWKYIINIQNQNKTLNT